MGIIYVLTNEAMPGLIKVGMIETAGKSVEDRMKELDSTGVPLPFECFAAWEIENAPEAEKALHRAFDDHRLRKRREFFRLSPDKPTAILMAFGVTDVTPSGDVVTDDTESEDDRRALDRERIRRQNFSFGAVGIEAGAELHSVFDDNVVCVVEDNKKVRFRDDVMSISRAALIVAGDHGRDWKTINGILYWKFEGTTLGELRDNIGEDQD